MAIMSETCLQLQYMSHLYLLSGRSRYLVLLHPSTFEEMSVKTLFLNTSYVGISVFLYIFMNPHLHNTVSIMENWVHITGGYYF